MDAALRIFNDRPWKRNTAHYAPNPTHCLLYTSALSDFESDRTQEKPKRARQTVSQKPQEKAAGGKGAARKPTARGKAKGAPAEAKAVSPAVAKAIRRKRRDGVPDDNPIYGGNDDDD